ncbi:hypothetical protein BA1DRAFT_01909 [Photorhabdus aegyptia]|uniref:Uncharacterized protein n=1 Tax=Photorhabdus aegyptia TaxID=2805098 RepID=A0A022PJ65_9GAMM|nr:hypothetical protein BA1DRAFT_01909 [Photorhabdus aegyptia]
MHIISTLLFSFPDYHFDEKYKYIRAVYISGKNILLSLKCASNFGYFDTDKREILPNGQD